MKNPYQDMSAKAFWRTAVAAKDAREIAGLWDPKRPYARHERIATFGSCFAQHFSRALAAQNYNWHDAEPPALPLAPEAARERNYGIFSARTGNIYTAAALRQWIDWALAKQAPPDEVWESNGRYFDPFRPAIEPAGFASAQELFASRELTLRALREIIFQSDHFVFTLGLTEAWISRAGRYVYAMCPGTSAGEFDATKHAFKNFIHAEILADMQHVVEALRSANERIGVLLTVSPVPLTATASGQHVITATTYSKSALRSVAGQLADSMPCVDYFPSYEIITATPFHGRYFARNLRSVTPEGVQTVMQSFFACLDGKFGVPLPPNKSAAPLQPEIARPAAAGPAARRQRNMATDDDAVCEEEMLAAFAPSTGQAQSGVAPNAGASKVCVIGNSHIGTLRWALKGGLFADPDMDIVFWGFSRQHFENVRIVNGLLIPPDRKRALVVSDGRYETICPQDFDTLLFVGGNFNTTVNLIWMKEHAGSEGDGTSSERALYNRLRARLRLCHAMKLMASIAPSYAGRIMFVPTPLVSEDAGERMSLQISPQELDRFNRLLAAILGESGITYVAQPIITIKDNKWTRSEYANAGFGGLGQDAPKGHDGNRYKHMNARYGNVILTAVRERLRQSAQPEQAAGTAAI